MNIYEIIENQYIRNSFSQLKCAILFNLLSIDDYR